MLQKTIVWTLSLLLACCACQVSAQYNWQSISWHGGGTCPNLEFDPSVQSRVYLTSDVAGLWRSDDLGEHWYFVTNGLGGLMVSQVAIAPTNSNVLYAATNNGVYYSTNAAQTWTASSTMNGQISFIRPNSYRSLAIDPNNPAKICVGTQSQQIFCSSNYGQSWQSMPLPSFLPAQTPPPPIPAMFITRDSSTLYVAFDQAVASYSFANQTWTLLGKFNGVTDMLEDKYLNNVYVAAGTTLSYMNEYTPGSWTSLPPVPSGDAYRVALSHPTNDSAQIYVSWWNASTYQGGVLMYQSQWDDWYELDSNFYPDESSDPTRAWASISTVQESLKVDPYNVNVLFRTDDWGVWRSDYTGYSWNEKIVGAPDVVATDIAVPGNGTIYVASMDDGLLMSTNNGTSYTALFPTTYANNTAGDVWRIVVIGSHIIATSSPWNVDYNQVLVSNNGGQSFQLITNGLPAQRPTINTLWGQGFPRALAVDPNNPNIVYMGMDGDDGGGLFVSRDGGMTWNYTPGQPGSKEVYHGLAVDPANSNYISWGAVGDNGGVYLSKDGGKTFQLVFSEMDWVFNLAVAPNGTIYAGGSWGGPALFVSDASEQHYSLLAQFTGGVGDAVDGIAINPTNPKMIAVSTVSWDNSAPCCFYLTKDGGQTWSVINGNLPDGQGSSIMTFDPTGQYLYITRYAGGAYRLSIAQ